MFHKIIEELSKELNIKYTYLSKDWITRLEKDNQIKYLAGNKFDLNPHALGLVLDDKYAFYDLLNNLNIPVCLHHILFRDNNLNSYAQGCNTYDKAIEYFNLYNQNVVLKKNNGSLGIGVYHITNKKNLIDTLDLLFKDNYSISICPYYDIKNEYRVIVLDNQVKLVYQKIRPIVYGDGESSIKELLIRFNPYYFKDKVLPEDILPKDRTYVYNWKFNLSRGAICSSEITSELKNKLMDLALTVSKKVKIVFASIDIIELKDGSLLVLEANSGVTIDKAINYLDNGYELAKSIYHDAIVKMFSDSSN